MATNLNSLLGGGGGIKAVQRGTDSIGSYSTQTTVTITAVDLSKTFVTFSNEGDNDVSRSFCRAYLSSSTTLVLERRNGTNSIQTSWEVVEFA